MENLKDLRREYDKSHLSRQEMTNDPLEFFAFWMREALASEELEPSAMNLSTVDAKGRPSSRIVLLKGFDDRGFQFYTNYGSRKGAEMEANGNVSLTIFWATQHRQVRINGQVTKLSEKESREYFQSRPKESQIGAWASSQSSIMTGHNELMDRYEEVARKYEEADVLPLPPDWGGYNVHPEEIEFWQGRPSRLHDRFHYTRKETGWKIDRLWP